MIMARIYYSRLVLVLVPSVSFLPGSVARKASEHSSFVIIIYLGICNYFLFFIWQSDYRWLDPRPPPQIICKSWLPYQTDCLSLARSMLTPNLSPFTKAARGTSAYTQSLPCPPTLKKSRKYVEHAARISWWARTLFPSPQTTVTSTKSPSRRRPLRVFTREPW